MIPIRHLFITLATVAIVALIIARPARAEKYQWTTFAGNTGGFGATNGPVSGAHFTYPSSIASDAADNLYIADSGTSIIRKITPGGIVSTLAGTALQQGSTDGPGSIALFNRCSGVAVDGSVLGISKTVVTPPAKAAVVPLARSSLYS